MRLKFAPFGPSGSATPGRRLTMTLLAKPAVCAAVYALSASANAAIVNNSTGLASPEQTVTFESVVLANEVLTTQFQEFGVTFSTAFANPNSRTFPDISGNRPGSFMRPAISRKADEELLQYRNAEQSGVYVFSSAEDRVPALDGADSGAVPLIQGFSSAASLNIQQSLRQCREEVRLNDTSSAMIDVASIVEPKLFLEHR